MRLLALLLVLFAAAAAGTAAPAGAQSAGGCQGFNGHWLTTWPGGTTKLHVVGRKGVYSYHGGILTGQVSDGVFSGTYAQDDGNTGTFRFALSADGNAFKGWYAPAAHPDQRFSWTGICSGP